MERVVITGMGFLSPLGNDWPTVREALYENRSAVRHMTEWDETDLNTRAPHPPPLLNSIRNSFPANAPAPWDGSPSWP